MKISKDFQKFINSLRCPICKNQLDGNFTELYCVQNPIEYTAKYSANSETPNSEKLVLFFNKNYYFITQESILTIRFIEASSFNLELYQKASSYYWYGYLFFTMNQKVNLDNFACEDEEKFLKVVEIMKIWQ